MQLEQARYEARLAQRQYDAVDPSNRLVAGELERRWNEKLERVAQLERTYAQAEREAEWNLTAEERAAITELSRDLPAIWSAETTTNQERKQLLRMAIESVQLDGIREAGQIEIQIRWRSGAVTSLSVKRSSTRRRLAEDARRKLFPGFTKWPHGAAMKRSPPVSIVLGLRSAFGRRFTSSACGIHLSAGRTGKRQAALSDQSRKTVRMLLVQQKVEQEVLCVSGLFKPSRRPSLKSAGS